MKKIKTEEENVPIKVVIDKTNKIKGGKRKTIFSTILILLILGGCVFFAWKWRISYVARKNQEKFLSGISAEDQKKLKELADKAKSGKPEDLLPYASMQYTVRDLSGSEKTYQDLIAKNKDNKGLVAFYQNNLGNVYRDEKKFDEAIKAYRAAIESNPQEKTSYINLGNLYQYYLSDRGNAKTVYEEAEKNISNSPDVEVLLGILMEEDSKKDEAATYFKKALEFDSNNQAAKAGLDRLK